MILSWLTAVVNVDDNVHCRWWQLPYYYAGIKCYDMVAGSQLLKSSYLLSKGSALELFPMLKRDRLVGALVYYDGWFIQSDQYFSLICTIL